MMMFAASDNVTMPHSNENREMGFYADETSVYAPHLCGFGPPLLGDRNAGDPSEIIGVALPFKERLKVDLLPAMDSLIECRRASCLTSAHPPKIRPSQHPEGQDSLWGGQRWRRTPTGEMQRTQKKKTKKTPRIQRNISSSLKVNNACHKTSTGSIINEVIVCSY